MDSQEPVNSKQVKRFVDLLADIQPRLYRYIAGLVGRFADADRIMQETRRRMLQKFGEFTQGSDFLIWAMTIAYACIQADRRGRDENNEPILSDTVLEQLKQDAVTATVCEKISYGDLKDCILKLPEKDRHLIQARYIDEQRVEAISDGSIQTEHSVIQALARIHDVLLDCVKQAMGMHEGSQTQDNENLPLDKSRLRGWILQAFEGQLNTESRGRLNTLLLESVEARRYYFEFFEISLTLRRIKNVQSFHDLDVSRTREAVMPPSLRKDLSSPESAAPAPISVMHPEPSPVRVVSRGRYTPLLYLLLFAACAVSVVMTVSWLRLRRETVKPPAVLKQTSHARWADTVTVRKTGTQFYPGVLRLEEGTALIACADGADVILQAPADIQITDNRRLILRRGRLSVRTGPSGGDFVVQTIRASVVSYAKDTSFGITAGAYGKTEVHVLQGQADLRVGSDPLRFDTHIRLAAKQAGLVDVKDTVNEIPWHGEFYLSRVPDENTFGIPGRRVDVSDLTAGGCGFGSGQKDFAINPLTGQLVHLQNNWEIWIPSTAPLESHVFNPVLNNPFIDGVLIAGRTETPLPVSSRGNKLETNPGSCGAYGMMIITDYSWTEKPWVLDGVPYGSREHPAILVHANAGITFDLHRLRQSLVDMELVRFTCRCGIPPISNQSQSAEQETDARMQVLIDGRAVFDQTVQHGHTKVYPVKTDITTQDRFLTLLCTNGNDGDNFGDWGIFAEPAIEIRLAEATSSP